QFVPLREELEFLNGYLEIEQTRFADRLRVQFEIEREALDEAVPSMLLQPLVENAIRHGIAVRATPGTIVVSARRAPEGLRVTIADDGPGLKGAAKTNGSGVGLANTRSRLETLYGSAHSFETRNGADGGLSVEILLPIPAARGAHSA